MKINEPLFLEPVFKERLWGGTKLQEMFNYAIPSPSTGEAWCVSGHKHGPSTIKNGPLEGQTLRQVWDDHRDLFSNEKGEEFPLLVKILDSKKDLSVQVHPDDTFAKYKEGETYGKTECWYIIDCDEDAEIIFGHHAKDKEELSSMIHNEKWDQLLRRIKVKPGDFYYVPSGTIHAIGAGIQILETQQNSDITYRVYDYDRKDDNGQTRDLHLNQSLEVTNTPHKDPVTYREKEYESGVSKEKLVEEEYFSVYKWDLSGEIEDFKNPTYLLVSVIDGTGEVMIDNGTYAFTKGDHFILPSTVQTFSILGEAELIVSTSNKTYTKEES